MGRVLSFFALLLAAGQALVFWPRLPPTMVSHFGLNGQPDAWQIKAAFFAFDFFTMVLLAAIFLGLPLMLRCLPSAMFNLPNKDYWLAPERREKSLEFIQSQLELIGGSALLLVVVVTQLAINANLTGSPSMPQAIIWPLVLVFIGFEIVCTVR